MLYQTFLLLAAVSFAKSHCVDKCSCTKIPIYENGELEVLSSVKCFSVDLTEPFPNNTREIIFESVDINFDNDQFLKGLRELNKVEFINCNLKSVNDFNQDGIKSLKISKSNLNEVRLNISGLVTLDLCQNELVNVSFRTLHNLKVLNLSANRLSLNEKSFSGLNDLKSLDLSNNQIKRLSDKIFLPLINLQYLNLTKNLLKSLNEAWFGNLIHLQQLDVSKNLLENVIPGNLELPSLTRLFLAGNPNLGISTPKSLLIGMGSRLQTFDASNTGLQKVPSALTHSIRALKLSKNSITTINCGDLDYYPLLQILDFTSNKLKIIEDDALGRLESLTIIYLSENLLIAIPKSLPEKLEILNLDRNNIQKIQSSDFLGLKRLQSLNLSDNNITKIEGNSFNHLLSLSSLDLSRNPLYIPAGLLTIRKLQTLKLSGIPSLLPAKEVTFPLTTPEYLIVLDLSYSPGLAHQLLADTAALAASKRLQELDLSVDGLEYVRSDLLHYLPQLRTLHLKGNPLNCTDLLWLALWMRRQGEYENREVTCVYPGDIWGVPLVDLLELEENQETTTKKSFVTKTINQAKLIKNRIDGLKSFENLSIGSNLTKEDNITYQKENLIKEKNLSKEENLNKQKNVSKEENLYKKENLTEGKKLNKKENLTKEENLNKEKNLTIEENLINKKNLTNYKEENQIIKENLNKQQNLTNEGNITEEEILSDNNTIEFFEINNVTISRSHYYGEETSSLTHPGMLILIFGVLLTTASLTVLTSQISKKRRRLSMRRQSMMDMEVGNLPGVTELW